MLLDNFMGKQSISLLDNGLYLKIIDISFSIINYLILGRHALSNFSITLPAFEMREGFV